MLTVLPQLPLPEVSAWPGEQGLLIAYNGYPAFPESEGSSGQASEIPDLWALSRQGPENNVKAMSSLDRMPGSEQDFQAFYCGSSPVPGAPATSLVLSPSPRNQELKARVYGCTGSLN